MATAERTEVPRRRWLVAWCTVTVAVVAAAVASFAQADGVGASTDGRRAAPPSKVAAGVGPDVVVFSLTDIGNYGSSGGFVGYSVGTESCNRGDAPLNWCDEIGGGGCAPGADEHDHPVIAQNLYRLEDDRFEQIGMSWLKHGFLSTNSPDGNCKGAGGQPCTTPPAGGAQLGVGCTDPYGSFLNGWQPLGRRSEVNASTGEFVYPNNSPGGPYTVYDQRIKVPTTDVDSAQNPGAFYWAEAQYIAPDDASSGNGLNNASYRRVTVGASPNFSLTMTDTLVEQKPAIFAWREGPSPGPTDISVFIYEADVPGDPVERFQVARKVTDLGGGQWHYEYAVRNHNSDRSARAFTVTFPAAATISNPGFHDVDSHSGEPYDTTDWTSAINSTSVSWSTDTFANDPNANALRFATMYNFWFDADQPPYPDASEQMPSHTIDLFKPGDPASITFNGFNALFVNGFEGGSTTAWSGHT